MKSIEVSARTIEEAVSDGLSKLGCSIADCKVEILQEGAKGLFGFFGSKPASVRLTLLAEADDEEADGLGINLQDALSREADKPRRQARPAQETKPAKQPQSPQGKQQDKPQPAEKQPVMDKQPAPDIKPAQPTQEKNRMRIATNPQVVGKQKNNDVLERFKSAPLPGASGQPESSPQEKRASTPKQPPRAPRRAPREPQEEALDVDAINRTPVPVPEHIEKHDPGTPEGIAQQFLIEVTQRMGVQVQVDVHTGEDGHVFAAMYGDTLGILIGRRGETLDALQYLTSLQVNRGREEYIRITLDTENYRAKREEALNRLAVRMANRAIKTGRKVSLEPMNPYERRILHSSLQNNPGVTTHSEGDEPYRHVVVVPER